MFWIGVSLLVVLACTFVLLPLLLVRRSDIQDVDRDQLNVAVYRERTEQADEALASEAKIDLLADTASELSRPVTLGKRRALFVAAFLMPLVALLVYENPGLGRGAITDVEIAAGLGGLAEASPEQYESFAGLVENRLAERPDDENLQFLLASIYTNRGQYEEAAALYDNMLKTFPGDPNLLSHYAEVLFVADGRRLTERADAAVDAALNANPHDITMLEIKGIGAMVDGRAAEALGWFERALRTGVTGERAQLIRMAVERIRQDTGTTASTGRSIDVTVSLETEQKDFPADAAVFVYARAVDGPPAPLAVQKLSPSALPAAVRLDESMAMMPGMSLAAFDRVLVIARLSLAGEVVPASGDVEARSAPLTLGDEPVSVRLELKDVLQ